MTIVRTKGCVLTVALATEVGGFTNSSAITLYLVILGTRATLVIRRRVRGIILPADSADILHEPSNA